MAWWRKARGTGRTATAPLRSRGPYREPAQIVTDLDWAPETPSRAACDAEFSAMVAPGSGDVWQPDTESDAVVILRAVFLLAVLATTPIVWLVVLLR